LSADGAGGSEDYYATHYPILPLQTIGGRR
jgi:hypothetical protein